MNHIYKTVWNATLGTWTAVQETAKSHGKSSDGKAARAASQNVVGLRFAFTLVASALLLASGQVMAVTGTGQDTTDIACFFDTTSQSVVCGDANTSVVDTYDGKQAKAVAVGVGAKTEGESNVALGANSSASHTSGLAIGAESKAHHNQTVAIGERANALGEADVSVGKGAGEGTTSTGRNVAIGEGAVASIYHQVSGQRVVKTQAEANNVIGIGTSAAAGIKGSHNIAMGAHANSEEAIKTALNNKSATKAEIGLKDPANPASDPVDRVTADNTIALGQRSLANKTAAVAVGQQAKALGNLSAAFGNGSKASGSNAVAAGSYATATGTNSVAIGGSQNNTETNKTLANAHYTVAIGGAAQATAQGAVAMGHNAIAAGKETVSLGAGSGSRGVDAANATGQIVQRTNAGQTSTIGLVHMTNIGYKAGADTVNNNYGVNIGYEAGAGGYNSYYGEGVAIGNKAGGVNKGNAVVNAAMEAASQAKGAAAGVIITGNTNTAISSSAGVNALGHDNVAIGKDAGGYSSGNSNIAIGRNAGRYQAKNPAGVYIDQFVADTFSNAKNTIAVGEWAHGSADDATAIGTRAKAGIKSSVALGKDAKTTGTASEEGALAIGRNAHADGQGSTAMGINARSAKQSIAIGTNANNTFGAPQTIGASSVSIGNNTNAAGENTVALGNQSTATGDKSTALGFDTKAEGQSSVVIGDSAQNKRDTGVTSHPHADQAVVVGVSSNVNSLGGVAIGSTTKTTGVYGTAVGIGSVNNTNFGVALGALSTTDQTIQVDRAGYAPVASAQTAVDATKANAAGVSVGGKVLSAQGSAPGQTAVRPDGVNDGDIIRRQIHNVAAGTDDTDAVNVAQLKAVTDVAKAAGTHYYSVNSTDTAAGNYNNDGATGRDALAAGVGALAKQNNSIAIGKDAKTDGDPTAVSDSVAIGHKATATGDLGLAIGSEATVTGDAGAPGGIAIGAAATSKNGGMAIGSDADAGNGTALVPGLAVRLNNNVALGDSARVKDDTNFRVALGTMSIAGEADLNAAPYTPTAGATLAGIAAPGVTLGEVSVGGDNTNYPGDILYRRITNVAAGAADTDAVNVSQLKAVADVAKAAGTHYYSVNDNGTPKGNYNNDGATGGNALAAGVGAQATHISSTAVGHDAKATNDAAVAIGWEAEASGNHTIALGGSSQGATGHVKTQAQGDSSMAIGFGAQTGAGASWSIAQGDLAKVGENAERSMAIGVHAAVADDATDAIAVGNSAKAGANFTVAVGLNAQATASGAMAQGNGAVAAGEDSVALGKASQATAKFATAVGNAANAGEHATAVGNGAAASGSYATAFGTGSQAAGGGSAALGNDAKASEWAAVAVGRDAQASNTAAVAIGEGARASHEHSVALGSGSETAAVDNTGRASATVGGITYSGFAADAPTSMVSVGRDEATIAPPAGAPIVVPAINRTITHVAAGRIAADSTDAINGSQLHATQTVIGNVADSVKDILGGNAAVGGDGKLNMTNIGGTGKGNIHDAIQASRTTVSSNNSSLTVNKTTDGTTGADNYDLSINAQGLAESAQLPVVYTKADGAKVYKHTDGNFYDAPNGGGTQVPTGNVIASMQNADGTTATPTTLANVKAGVNATDAVNVSQLQGAAAALGGGAGIDPATGVFTAPNYVLTDGNPAGGVTSTYNDVGAALSGLNTAVTKPLTFAGDSGANVESKLGSTLNVKGGATGTLSDGNIGVVADGANNTLNIKLAQNINLGAAGSVQTGNTTVNNAGITINEYDQAGAITKTVSLTSNGLDNGGNKISNVADGAAPNDAVNFSQLQALQNTVNSGWGIGNGGAAPVGTVKPGAQVDFVAGNSSTKVDVTHDATNGNSKVTVSAAPGALQYTGTNNADGSNTPNADQFTPTNQVTLVGKDGNTDKGVTINNVAPGAVAADSKQAINGSQLHAVGDSTAAALGGASAFDPATGTVTAGLNVGGTTHTSVQDALNAINTTAGAGWNLQANGGAASNVPSNGTVNVIDGKNTKVTLTGTELKVDVVDNPTFTGKVTAGGGLDVAGNLTAAAGTNVDMGNNIIHNVADGVADTDAVNVRQMRAMSGNITNITNQIKQVDARVTNVDNRVTHLSGRVDGIDARVTNVDNRVTQVDNRVTEVDNRVTNVDNRVTQVDSRVTDLTGRVDGIDTRVTDVTNLVGPNLTNPDGTKGLEVYDVSKQTLTEHKTVIEALNQVKREGTKYSHTQDNGEAPIIGPSNASSAGAPASTATGLNAIVDKEAVSGLAAGHRARVRSRGRKAIAAGHEAIADGESAVAIGDGAQALAEKTIAIGTKNVVRAARSGAIGDPTTIVASATDSYSIGNNNTVNTADTFVLGNNVVTSVANSVYLGAGAAATAAPTAQTAGMATYNAQTIDGVTHHYAGGTPAGVVSVGDVGQERRIQNVAAGLVSPTSTDAINGSQLYQTNAAIGNLSNRINANHDKAMGGIASAMASAGLPQAYLPGKSMIAMGVGAYQGRSAVAVGVSTISDNGRWIIKGSVNANNKGNVGATLGAGYQW